MAGRARTGRWPCDIWRRRGEPINKRTATAGKKRLQVTFCAGRACRIPCVVRRVVRLWRIGHIGSQLPQPNAEASSDGGGRLCGMHVRLTFIASATGRHGETRRMERADDVEPGWIDTLLSPRGEALLARLAADPPTPQTELRAITQLRTEYPAELVAAALTQARLRARARAKFSRADRMLFTAEGLEQASTEAMSRNHARRYEAFARVADLCTGIGGDLIALAAGSAVRAVDLDPVHLRL